MASLHYATDDDADVELVGADVSRNRIGTPDATESVVGGLIRLYVPFHRAGRRFDYAATNVTLSGNIVQGGTVEGGLLEIFNKDGADLFLDLRNATVALNEVGGPLGSIFDLDAGWSGPPSTDYAPVTIRLANTILAQNTATLGDCPLQGPELQLVSLGYNLLGDVASCGGLVPAQTDLDAVDPLFGPYGTLGGLVPALPITAGSPAVDGGDPTGCRDVRGELLSTDQRGLPRPVGPSCDIGAFELQ